LSSISTLSEVWRHALASFIKENTITEQKKLHSTAMRTVLAIFLLPLATVTFVVYANAQGENSICGAYKSGELTIPSYRFNVVNVDGKPVPGVEGSAFLEITEGNWIKESWIDGHWEDVPHNMSIPVEYDPKTDQFVSRELAKVPIAHRKKGGFLGIGSNCWDRVQSVTFDFSAPNGDNGFFKVFFPNERGKKSPLPDPSAVITVKLEYDKKGNGIR